MTRNRLDDQRMRSMQAEVHQAVASHPLLARMRGDLSWADLAHDLSVRVVDGRIVQLNRNRRYTVAEWLWWVAHARLHLALGHPWDVRKSFEQPVTFATARCLVVNDLIFQLGIGRAPTVDDRLLTRQTLPQREVDSLVIHLQEHGIPDHFRDCGGVRGDSDVVGTPPASPSENQLSIWNQQPTRASCAAAFAEAIRCALQDSISEDTLSSGSIV